MWPVLEVLRTIPVVAHITWAWLPTITTILRFVTAVNAFIVGVHHTIRYICNVHSADQEVLVGEPCCSRSTSSARHRSAASSALIIHGTSSPLRRCDRAEAGHLPSTWSGASGYRVRSVEARDCSKIGVSGPARRAEVRRDGHGE